MKDVANTSYPEKSRAVRRTTLCAKTAPFFDAIVLCLILAIGAFEVATYQRIESISSDSSVYMVLARNLLETGRYEFNFRPHTVYPPGFPVLLAGISLLTGSRTYEIFIRFIPVITAAALLTWYFVLRLVWNQSIAAGACLLAATAAPIFRAATGAVLSDMPYFLISGGALLSLIRIGEHPGRRTWTQMALASVFLFCTVMTVLTRSSGVALCAAMLQWAFVIMPKHVRTLAIFGALVGLAAFAAWTVWTKNQAAHGSGSSYADQFALKDPHNPEFGAASIADLVVRAVSNAPVQSTHIAMLLLRLKWAKPNTVHLTTFS